MHSIINESWFFSSFDWNLQTTKSNASKNCSCLNGVRTGLSTCLWHLLGEEPMNTCLRVVWELGNKSQVQVMVTLLYKFLEGTEHDIFGVKAAFED